MTAPGVATYFQRVYRDGARVEFCVAGWAADPAQRVAHVAADGTVREWDRRECGDLLVFTSPPDWDGRAGLLWRYDPARQTAVPMPPADARRAALHHRVSVLT